MPPKPPAKPTPPNDEQFDNRQRNESDADVNGPPPSNSAEQAAPRPKGRPRTRPDGNATPRSDPPRRRGRPPKDAGKKKKKRKRRRKRGRPPKRYNNLRYILRWIKPKEQK